MPDTNSLSMPDRVIITLENHGGEFHGTSRFANVLRYTANCKEHFIRVVRMLEEKGIITIIKSNGGRGRKTIYRRNRNQPGLARKR